MNKSILLILLSATVILSACAKVPSDQKMIDNFNKNKSAFEELVTMLKHDKMYLLINTKKNSHDDFGNLPANRITKYIDLLKKANLIYLTSNPKFNSIIFTYYYYGIAKEYVYSKIPPSPLVTNLEVYNHKTNVQAYRHIEGDWYLYFNE